jgi:hypothetical protein
LPDENPETCICYKVQAVVWHVSYGQQQPQQLQVLLTTSMVTVLEKVPDSRRRETPAKAQSQSLTSIKQRTYESRVRFVGEANLKQDSCNRCGSSLLDSSTQTVHCCSYPPEAAAEVTSILSAAV